MIMSPCLPIKKGHYKYEKKDRKQQFHHDGPCAALSSNLMQNPMQPYKLHTKANTILQNMKFEFNENALHCLFCIAIFSNKFVNSISFITCWTGVNVWVK